MRLAGGRNVFGPPKDKAEAIALLRAAVLRGVNHIDTAHYYGPAVVNELIREALHPYPSELVIVSKVGARRGTRGEVLVDDSPNALRRGIEENLRILGIKHLPVVNLRVMRNCLPNNLFDDQLEAMVSARGEGLIGGIGLSNVTVPQLLHALASTEIICVQNAFYPGRRQSWPVLRECRLRNIAFVPFGPLGFGGASLLGSATIRRIATRSGCTPAQLCLAWALDAAPNIALIPGTASLRHLHENLAASSIHIEPEDLKEICDLDEAVPPS
jgi:aryl-alcohol dehydrogenase-like predicted oxidoreductase